MDYSFVRQPSSGCNNVLSYRNMLSKLLDDSAELLVQLGAGLTRNSSCQPAAMRKTRVGRIYDRIGVDAQQIIYADLKSFIVIVIKGGFMKFAGTLSAALLICYFTANLYAGMYSWTDENGVKHYSNVAPAPEAEEIEEIQVNESDAAPTIKQSNTSNATQTAKQRKRTQKRPQKSVNASADKSMSLRIAANTGRLEEVERLLNEGADVNAKAMNGMTPLILAAWMGHTEVVELLLRNGADVNAKTNTGSTALKLATDRGHQKIIALLREYGA